MPSASDAWRGRTETRLAIAAVTSSLLFLLAAWLSLAPAPFNLRMAHRINEFSHAAPDAFINIALSLTSADLEAVTVVGLMWMAWFLRREADARAFLLAGLAGAIVAAFLAHVLQQVFPSEQKPLYLAWFESPERLREMIGSHPTPSGDGRSFPSERGTLFAGVALATTLAAPRLGLLALGSTCLVGALRTLLGHHYPMDIVGSIALAGAWVCMFALCTPVWLGALALRAERQAPLLFYAVCALFTYQLITTFDGLRWLAGAARGVLSAARN